METEEVIVYAMIKRNGGITTNQVADAINHHRLRLRKDDRPMTSKQVYTATCRFPRMFTEETGRIMLVI